jgi:hypothetical protein
MAKKMSIDDASKLLNVSKEAIHNRIRRGSLKYVVENGIKYVYIDENIKTKKQPQKNNPYEEKLNNYLIEQNKELQQKIDKLESLTNKLREEKEQLLIEERKRIEQIYKEKDEQLKNILNAISSKFLLEAKPLDEDEHFEVEIEEKEKIISLKKYLKSLNISDKKRTKLLKKISKIAKKDKRFECLDKKIYLNLSKYDYSDIF